MSADICKQLVLRYKEDITAKMELCNKWSAKVY